MTLQGDGRQPDVKLQGDRRQSEGGRREVDLYPYIFCIDILAFFYVGLVYQLPTLSYPLFYSCGRREVDLYPYIFCIDILAFFYVGLFYQSAVRDKSPFEEVIHTGDQFPYNYVAVLMTQFFLIVINRILYLVFSAPLRILYHLTSLLLHLGYQMRLFWNANLIASHNTIRAYLAIKSISLALSALQLKHGPPGPASKATPFLTRRATWLRWQLFRVYRMLPFLYELHLILDWWCTKTTLPLYDWLKV
ncbi:unnamed protein product [Closterium sp. Naga37s-1]|nr:unnamed protein product [Closterium sp. Naga37s-1]